MKQFGHYDIEDPNKIQGRDEVDAGDRSLAGLRLRAALEALGDTYGRVLLLGCGAGRYVRAMARARQDLEFQGGDLSLNALHEARDRDPSSEYVALDASRLPYQDESFSAVLFFDLLEHVPDYQRLLCEVLRTLIPGGILHFFVPLESQPGTLYHLLRHSDRLPIHRWKHDHVGHVNSFTSDEVIRTVWDQGFVVESVRFGFHPTGQIHDVVDYWHRERSNGNPGVLPQPAVDLITRGVFLFTWRLQYVEDRLYDGPALASGLHLTARRPK
jgi:SAM-dependent methyltransferase